MTNWQPLTDEFQLWQDAGITLPFWWRDDDAIEPTAQLETLISIAADLGIPCHLAVIPKFATEALAKRISTTDLITPLIHGWAHENHAPADQKKAEFGATRQIEGCATNAIQSLQYLQNLFGGQLQPMFVPPWNRINPDLGQHLVAIGYDALSTYGPRKSRLAAPNLTQINTHLDPIAWRSDRSLVPPEILISQTVKLMQDRRLGQADNTEPFGFLTHHLVHDATIWAFVKQFLTIMLEGPIKPFRYGRDPVE
jgi:hypothetical protein